MKTAANQRIAFSLRMYMCLRALSGPELVQGGAACQRVACCLAPNLKLQRMSHAQLWALLQAAGKLHTCVHARRRIRLCRFSGRPDGGEHHLSLCPHCPLAKHTHARTSWVAHSFPFAVLPRSLPPRIKQELWHAQAVRRGGSCAASLTHLLRCAGFCTPPADPLQCPPPAYQAGIVACAGGGSCAAASSTHPPPCMEFCALPADPSRSLPPRTKQGL